MATSSVLWEKGQVCEVVEFSCNETKPYYIKVPMDNGDECFMKPRIPDGYRTHYASYMHAGADELNVLLQKMTF